LLNLIAMIQELKSHLNREPIALYLNPRDHVNLFGANALPPNQAGLCLDFTVKDRSLSLSVYRRRHLPEGIAVIEMEEGDCMPLIWAPDGGRN
jgi:hypothetical protein